MREEKEIRQVVTFSLPLETIHRLRAYCGLHGLKQSHIVQELLERFLKKGEK